MKNLQIICFSPLRWQVFTLPMAGCSDDDTAPKGEDVERGDKACRIETFTLNFSDGTTLSGDVYDYDKSVDLSYTTAEFEMMKSATATLTLSEGATVSPDPSQTADYTQSLSFTVTAKDGKTTRTYTTKPVEKVLEGYTKVEAATSKTATEMGIGTAADYKFVGVSGDKLVVGKKGLRLQDLRARRRPEHDGIRRSEDDRHGQRRGRTPDRSRQCRRCERRADDDHLLEGRLGQGSVGVHQIGDEPLSANRSRPAATCWKARVSFPR